MEYYHRSSDKTINTVTRAYDRAIEDINREIQDIFERYSDNGMLSNQEARTILNTPISRTEIDDLKNAIITIKDERIKKQLISRINAPAYAARITRLQALKEKIYIESKKIADIEISSDTSGFMDTINNAYYRTMFDIQKGIGVGFDVAAMPSSTIESILKNPWSGRHFSERVWGNTDVLAGKLTEIVTSGMMSGKSLDKMAKELEYMSNVGKHAAARIIRTETTYMANAAEMESYKVAEIDKYIFIATLDLRTSDICREHDNNVYEVNKAVPGENMPPLHPNCRSTTIAYFDEETLSSIERRAVDPESGKDYKIPADTTYEQWYKEKVVNRYGQDQAEVMKKKIINKASDRKQHKKYREILGAEIPESFEKFQDLKYNKTDEWDVFKGDYRKINAYNKIVLNEPLITKDLQEVAKASGTELVGLEYRLKSKESYLRKVNMDSNNSLDSKIIDDTIASTNDVIRFTYQSSHEDLVNKYFEVNNLLREKGYEQIKLKNTWLIKSNPYKGINCNYVTSSGQKFEIQYHTPESFELKNGELHNLYEKWRIINDKSSKEAIELSSKMSELSSKLKYPKDIDKVR